MANLGSIFANILASQNAPKNLDKLSPDDINELVGATDPKKYNYIAVARMASPAYQKYYNDNKRNDVILENYVNHMIRNVHGSEFVAVNVVITNHADGSYETPSVYRGCQMVQCGNTVITYKEYRIFLSNYGRLLIVTRDSNTMGSVNNTVENTNYNIWLPPTYISFINNLCGQINQHNSASFKSIIQIITNTVAFIGQVQEQSKKHIQEQAREQAAEQAAEKLDEDLLLKIYSVIRKSKNKDTAYHMDILGVSAKTSKSELTTRYKYVLSQISSDNDADEMTNKIATVVIAEVVAAYNYIAQAI